MTRQYCSVCKEWLDMEAVPTSDGDDDDGVAWYRCPQCQGFLPKLKNATEDEAEEPAPDPDPGTPEPEPAGGSAGEKDGAAQVTVGGDGDAESDLPTTDEEPSADRTAKALTDLEDSDPMPWDSPADMTAARRQDQELDLPDVSLDAVEAFADDLDGGSPAESVETDGTADDEIDVTDTIVGEAEPGEDGEDSPDENEPLHEFAALLAEKDPMTAVAYRPEQTFEVGQCIHHLAWDDCGVVVGKDSLPGGRQTIKVFFEGAGVVRLIEGAKP